jgi:Zn-finger protein
MEWSAEKCPLIHTKNSSETQLKIQAIVKKIREFIKRMQTINNSV